MNILMVNRLMGEVLGGGELFDYNAAKYLAQRGHDVTILTSGFNNLIELEHTRGSIKLVRMRVPYLRSYSYKLQVKYTRFAALILHFDMLLFELGALLWFIKQGNSRCFDVVHCCSMFILSKLIIIIFSLPVVSWLPGPPSKFTQRIIDSLVGNPLFKLFTHGSTEWSLMSKGYTRGREYAVIEPGVDLVTVDSVDVDRHPLRSVLGISSDALLGITTARLVPVKNHSLLLEAVAIAKSRGLIWHWMIIGNGPLEQSLKILAKTLGITAQIHFLGYKPQAEVHRWLAVADLFALTSSYESFSIASLEAMAHRLPVIGTQVGYLQQLISDSRSGRIVPLGQPELLAEVLTEMADVDTRKQLGVNGRAFVEQLDWPMIAEKLECYYKRAITGE